MYLSLFNPAVAWLGSEGPPGWNPAWNLDDADNTIALTDLVLFAESWLK